MGQFLCFAGGFIFVLDGMAIVAALVDKNPIPDGFNEIALPIAGIGLGLWAIGQLGRLGDIVTELKEANSHLKEIRSSLSKGNKESK